MLQQFAPLSDDRLLQLVDCRESLTLKGTPNSVIGWIQVRAVWGPHVRLDERDVLTPSLIAPLVSGVAGLSASSSSKALNTLNILCKNRTLSQLLKLTLDSN